MFNSIISSTTGVTPGEFLLCSVISLAFGAVIALIHSFKNMYSKNMLLSLVVLPVVIQTVIMLVNGNIGTGIAVMGAFSLVRFRSAQGNAREITSIFLATTVGLAMASGFVAIAGALIILIGVVTIILASTSIGDITYGVRDLKITIPENLDFEGIFDDIFDAYTSKITLDHVKSVNMGSLFELKYRVVMKKNVSEKAFIDAIRCRNGNLTISLSRASTPKEEL